MHTWLSISCITQAHPPTMTHLINCFSHYALSLCSETGPFAKPPSSDFYQRRACLKNNSHRKSLFWNVSQSLSASLNGTKLGHHCPLHRALPLSRMYYLFGQSSTRGWAGPAVNPGMEQLLPSTHLYCAGAFQLIFEDKNGERFLYPLFIIGQLEGVANFPRSQSPL